MNFQCVLVADQFVSSKRVPGARRLDGFTLPYGSIGPSDGSGQIQDWEK